MWYFLFHPPPLNSGITLQYKPRLHYSVDLQIQTYRELVRLNMKTRHSEYPWRLGYTNIFTAYTACRVHSNRRDDCTNSWYYCIDFNQILPNDRPQIIHGGSRTMEEVSYLHDNLVFERFCSGGFYLCCVIDPEVAGGPGWFSEPSVRPVPVISSCTDN